MSQKKHGKRTDTEREVAPDDADLFRRHLADARELDFEVPVPKPRKVVPQARFRRADEQSVLEESMQADVEETETNGGDSLRFHRSHVGRRLPDVFLAAGQSLLGQGQVPMTHLGSTLGIRLPQRQTRHRRADVCG